MSLQLIIGGIDLSGTNGVDANGVQWSVDSFGGWGGVASTVDVVQKPRSSGGWAGSAYGKARTISIAGKVAAPTQDLLTAAIDSLIAATTLASTTLTVIEGSRTRYQGVRRSDEIIWSYTSAQMAEWSIALVAPDPRKLGSALVATTALPVSTGGTAWGHAWPETWTATTVSGTLTLTNPGNTVGPVVLRIDGPCTGPQISHIGAASSSITFSPTFALGAGEWLTINMDTRQVLANDQSNRAQYITSRGWSGFDPGINTWAFTASVYSALSLLTVTATPAGD